MIVLLLALACTPKTAPNSPPEEASQPAPETDPDGAREGEPEDLSEAECKELQDGRSVCFPTGQVCTDPHGIGDGKPIVVDCWTSGGRMCHPASEIWPACAGGWIQGS